MNNLDLYSMLALGLFGTGHCLGMCGPLVLAFPASTGKFASHAFYHLGRTMTYVAIGAAVGAVGTGLKYLAPGSNHLAWMVRIQMGFALVAALFLVWLGLARLKVIEEPSWMLLAQPGAGGILRYALGSKSHRGMFLTGLLFGILPCGLSFAAFARALPSGGAAQGALLLAAFAAGTLPGLLVVGTGASGLARRFSRQSDILSGLLMIVMAVSLSVHQIAHLFFR